MAGKVADPNRRAASRSASASTPDSIATRSGGNSSSRARSASIPSARVAQERLVGIPKLEHEPGETVEDRDVGTRADRQVHVGERGKLRAPRVDDDETGAVEHPLANTGADHRMSLRGVAAKHEEA